MARILFAWELGIGGGHLALLQPLVQGFATRGHDVFFAAGELEAVRGLPQNVRLLQAPKVGSPRKPFPSPRTFAHVLHNTVLHNTDQIEAAVRTWHALLDFVSPDLIVCEHAPLALLASRGRSTRRVVLGSGFTLPADVSPWPDLRPWLPGSPEAMALEEDTVLARVNTVMERVGGSALMRLGDLYSQVDRRIVVGLRELDPYQREANEFIPPWPPEGGAAPEWPAQGSPRLFAYTRSYERIWQAEMLISMLRELDFCSLVMVSGGVQPALEKFQAPQVRIVTKPLDIQRVAAEADFAVVHSGVGTTTELLRAGVPTLHIPITLEQSLVAKAVVDLGGGMIAEAQRPELLAIRLQRLASTISTPQSGRSIATMAHTSQPSEFLDRLEAMLTQAT